MNKDIAKRFGDEDTCSWDKAKINQRTEDLLEIAVRLCDY